MLLPGLAGLLLLLLHPPTQPHLCVLLLLLLHPPIQPPPLPLPCLQTLAIALQSRISEVMHVDIHPAAYLGWGILMDHATGVVIGETAVII